jgi:hypothetical protein
MLSDDLPGLPEERLRIAEQLLPLIDRRPRLLDWFDSAVPGMVRLDLQNQTGIWHLIAVFNWANKPQDFVFPLAAFDLPASAYFAREFWTADVHRVNDNQLNFTRVPPHGVRLVALTPISQGAGGNPEQAPRYLGGDLHISQGLEVAQWAVSDQGGLILQLERPGKVHGIFDLYLPSNPMNVTFENSELHWQQIGQDLYRFQVQLNQSALVHIT